MMATAIYKVVQEFELDGELKKVDDEVTLRSRDGEILVKQGKIVEDRFLDPEIQADADMIGEVDAKHEEEHQAAVVKEEAREEQHQQDLEEKDAEEAREKEAAEDIADAGDVDESDEGGDKSEDPVDTDTADDE